MVNDFFTACPSEQIFKNCSYEFSCDARNVCGDLPEYEGCCCPYGLYKHGDRCVKKEECPCVNDGIKQVKCVCRIKISDLDPPRFA